MKLLLLLSKKRKDYFIGERRSCFFEERRKSKCMRIISGENISLTIFNIFYFDIFFLCDLEIFNMQSTRFILNWFKCIINLLLNIEANGFERRK